MPPNTFKLKDVNKKQKPMSSGEQTTKKKSVARVSSSSSSSSSAAVPVEPTSDASSVGIENTYIDEIESQTATHQEVPICEVKKSPKNLEKKVEQKEVKKVEKKEEKKEEKKKGGTKSNGEKNKKAAHVEERIQIDPMAATEKFLLDMSELVAAKDVVSIGRRQEVFNEQDMILPEMQAFLEEQPQLMEAIDNACKEGQVVSLRLAGTAPTILTSLPPQVVVSVWTRTLEAGSLFELFKVQDRKWFLAKVRTCQPPPVPTDPHNLTQTCHN